MQVDGDIDIYARVSRLKRDEKRCPPVEGQVAVCRDVLEDRGLRAGKVWIDPGRSAWNPRVKRPDWDNLMRRLELRQAVGMITYDLERFSRQPMDGERLIQLASSGLLVLDSESVYDLRTANGKKSFRDAMTAGAYYSDRLSTRSSRGKRVRAMNGEPNGSVRPFGFEDDRMTVRESEARVLRWMADRLLHGGTVIRLVLELNDRGILTARGRPWTRVAVRDVLTRDRNCGRIIHTDPRTKQKAVVARLPGEPIMSEEQYELVCSFLASRRRGRPVSPMYLCSAIAICGFPDCGKPLHGRPQRNVKPYPDGEVRRQYWCGPKISGGCNRLTIDQRTLDRTAEVLTIEILADERHAAAIAAATREVEGRIVELDRGIGQAEEVARRLSERLGHGEIDLDRYDAAIKPLDARLAKLRAERETLTIPAGTPERASKAEWRRRWKAATHEERRQLLSQALRGRRLVVLPQETFRSRQGMFDHRRVVVVPPDAAPAVGIAHP